MSITPADGRAARGKERAQAAVTSPPQHRRRLLHAVNAAIDANPVHRWLLASAPDTAATCPDPADIPAVLNHTGMEGARAVQLIDLDTPTPTTAVLSPAA